MTVCGWGRERSLEQISVAIAAVAAAVAAAAAAAAVRMQLWNEAFKRSCSNEITVFGAVLRDCKPSLHAFLECMKGQHKSVSNSCFGFRV